MYFHTNDQTTIAFLCAVATNALQHGQSLRIDVDDQGRLRIKRGESVWSPPFTGTEDPYREGG